MTIEFLVQMAWKSVLISGGALAIAALLRSRPAGERAAVIRTAFALLLLLPLLALLLPALPVVAWAAPAVAPLPTDPAALEAMAAYAMPAGDAALAADPVIRDDPATLILFAWLGGVAMVGLRLIAGLWTLRRWTRIANPVECPIWRQAFAAAVSGSPTARNARLLVSDVPSPLGWGWLRPVILIDRDTIRHPDEAEAVIAHEIAHFERRDWLLLILARSAVALFWFNPLLWLLERRLGEEAEEAADARALVRVEPARYAQTLLSCARQFPALPATGIADAGIARRVKAVLDGRLGRSATDPKRARLAAIACILFAAPVAALKPVAAAPEAPAAPAAPAALAAAPAQPATPATLAVPAPLPAPAALVPAVPAVPVPLAVQPALPPRPPMTPHPAAMARPAPMPALALAMAHPAAPARPRRDRGDDWSPVDSEELSREIATAVAEATRAAAEVRANAGRIAASARAAARASARAGLAAGSAGMRNGAIGMERGARQMEAEADRLRSPEYRAAEIARRARRGETVTDRELQDMIPELREGAREMREGAEEMREGADEMLEDDDS